MMNKTLRKRKQAGLAFAVALAFSAMATATFAAPMNLSDGDKITLTRTGAYGGGTAGGEFRATSSTQPAGDSFLTFCLEYSETIVLGQSYYVDVNSGTVQGGSGSDSTYTQDVMGTTTFDPLSKATAWLYTQFSNNNLNNVSSFLYLNNSWADSLQKAIWFLENEKSQGYLSADANAQSLVTLATAQVQDMAWTDVSISRVRVLNLYDSYNATTHYFSGNHQDQLYITPLETTTQMIPEPETYAMLLAGLGLMGFVARRRRNNSV